MSNSIDQQFVEYVVKSLVGNPDKVVVERRIDEKGVLLELTVDPEDLGRVIGKRGATAQSLRTLLRALGTKNDARYNLKIVDNGFPQEDRPKHQKDDRPKDDKVAVADEPTEADEPAEEPEEEPKSEKDDVISKTRKELAELDDLDL